VKNVVIKGGHLGDSRSEYCTDWLFTPDDVFEFADRRFPTAHTHGTGCTFSACIAAELAKGFETLEAVQTAKKYITEAIRNPLNIGAGHGPINHWAYRD
jgi:phosphomethylpyrimidine kinase